MIRVKILIVGSISLLTVYVIGLGQRAIVLVSDPSLLAKTFGILLAVFPILAIWSVYQEVTFGLRCERLSKRLDSEDYRAVELGLRPSGKALPEDAGKAVQDWTALAKQEASDWRVWFRLAEAFDAAGDRKSARKAARTAIRLSGG